MLHSAISTSKACFYFPTDNNMGQGKADSFLHRILPLIIQVRVIQTSNCACHCLQMVDSKLCQLQPSDGHLTDTKCQ